jgi:hypothetical protein
MKLMLVLLVFLFVGQNVMARPISEPAGGEPKLPKVPDAPSEGRVPFVEIIVNNGKSRVSCATLLECCSPRFTHPLASHPLIFVQQFIAS